MLAPLTHHEIFSLIAPFAQRGLQVNLSACDRKARRIVFNPVEHHAPVDASEVIALESLPASQSQNQGRYRIIRTFTHHTQTGALQARLQAQGEDITALLEPLLAIAPQRLFTWQDHTLIAKSYVIDLEQPTAPLIITAAEARVEGLRVALDAPVGALLSVTLTLKPDADHASVERLPDDLLAVLGSAWRPLRFADGQAHTQLRIARREPAKTRAAAARFSDAVAHLDATLSQSPAQFHPRFKHARWGVVLRRMLPLLSCIALLIGALVLQFFVVNHGVAIHPLALGAPPLMMVIVLILTRHEMPAFELPPLPKPLPYNDWQESRCL